MRRRWTTLGLAAAAMLATLMLWPSAPVAETTPAAFVSPGLDLPHVPSPPGSDVVREARTLPDGEYACYDPARQLLAGWGFTVSGDDYADLERVDRGRVRMRDGEVTFTGGYLDGQVGRAFDGRGFAIGDRVRCERW